MIQEIIKADTAHAYMSSSSGFWYHYEIAQDSTRTPPQPDDEVILVYNIMTFTNDTIYTHDDIGVVQMRVDKEQLFPGMRGAVKLLREGERATFLFPSSQAYGYHGDTNKIPPIVKIDKGCVIRRMCLKARMHIYFTYFRYFCRPKNFSSMHS